MNAAPPGAVLGSAPRPDLPAQQEVTYVTIADEKFFLGAVGLVNSLRLTGNDGRIVVFDAGLTAEQRALLQEQCDVRRPPVAQAGVFVVFLKPAAVLLGLTGTVVLIDSDVVVTRDLSPILAEAAAGKICVVGSHANPGRRFPDEWVETFCLQDELRRQRYVGAGMVALDIDRWHDFMQRWLDLCERVPEERASLPFELPGEMVPENPFAFPEQDVLNALLMTEVPAASVLDLGLEASPGPPHNDVVRVVDRARLRCTIGAGEPFLLHYWNHPKPWLPAARCELAFDAYVELTARVLAADDVPIRLAPGDLPVWLRDGLVGRFARCAPRRVRRAVRAAVGLLPEPLERRARDIGGAVARRIHLG
ncbi:MAG: hypothetical protein ACXVZO_01415 [Gaiellaceae bacterium]